ncbi:MAG: hypothetical protein ACLFM1_09650 [Bacteroidales bacterium]
MRRLMRTYPWLIPAIIMLLTACDDPRQEALQVKSRPLRVVEPAHPPKDSTQDRIAAYLCGKTQAEAVSNLPQNEWNAFSENLSKNWQALETNRLSAMDEWVENYLYDQISDSLPLFYPFSGPDFLHAYHLFPNSENYILLAKEKIGKIPDFSSLSGDENAQYLHYLNYFLRDIYQRSYFITSRMQKDIGEGAFEGILPVFYVFLHQTGHEILKLEYLEIDSSGQSMVVPDSLWSGTQTGQGVRFTIRQAGAEPLDVKSMTYLYCDISNEGFRKQPEVKRWLNRMETGNTFVKSASYLMHYRTFSDIRNLILNKSEAVFQDDTGIPFRHFDKDNWNFTFFGTYQPPISDFGPYLMQNDLAAAFEDTSYQHSNLPFSIGYHWTNRKQHYILAKKK